MASIKKYKISSETCAWAINWVNKVFTTTQPITTIDELLVNSIPYAQYSFSGNTIVLDDAPSVWAVVVSYEYSEDKDYLDNSGWIVWETCTWESDGTNRVFTTFFPISLIDEVRVNNIAVTGYSFKWNSILLQSAPSTTHKVAVDYFRSDYGVTDYDRWVYPTILDLQTKVYNEISQDDTSVQYQEDLVKQAIIDWVGEITSIVTDKSRNISFALTSAWTVSVGRVENSISSVTITSSTTLPPVGRFLTKDWEFFDYSLIAGGVATISSFNNFPENGTECYVGYRLPRNYKYIKRVFSNYDLRPSAGIVDFLNIHWGYLINNWFIYFPNDGTHTIEIELKNTPSFDDSSIVYIDEEDVGVVIYYALRQLYASRENEKLLSTSQLYGDKLWWYKRKLWQKRIKDSGGKIKTAIWLY